LQRIANFSLASKNYQFPQSFHIFERQKKTNFLFITVMYVLKLI